MSKLDSDLRDNKTGEIICNSLKVPMEIMKSKAREAIPYTNTGFTIEFKIPHSLKGLLKSSKLNTKSRKFLIYIYDKDGLSLAKYLVVTLAHVKKDPKYNQIRDIRRSLQIRLAKELHGSAGVPITDIDDSAIQKFELLLNVQVIVYSEEWNYSFCYVGKDNRTKIFLLKQFSNGSYHYSPITNIKTFLKMIK